MIVFQLNGQGEEIAMDENAMTYPEGLELERQTGLGATKYAQDLNAGTTRSTAALYWIGAVRQASARDGVSFRDASRALPFEAFAEGLDLMATMRTLRRPEPPVDPTEPTTSGPTQPTSPDTSVPPPPEASPSPTSASATSDSSPTTSASAPGTGIA